MSMSQNLARGRVAEKFKVKFKVKFQKEQFMRVSGKKNDIRCNL